MATLPFNLTDPSLQTSGVYAITCAKTGKVYVGSSNNIANRWYAHFWELHKGKHHTEATRTRMSVAGKGRIFTPEHKAKIGAANKGKVRTLEVREKMKASWIARRARFLITSAKRKVKTNE